MMIEILLVLIVVSISCSLMGSLMLLRESIMIADAISHTVLLGIVIAYYFVEDLNSPWLIIGATVFGVVTVIAIQLLVQTGRVANDAAMGLVFTLFFAIAVVIISKFYTNVHLDLDMVFLGQVELAPLKRTELLGLNMPTAFVQGVIVLLINIIFILINYVALKVRLFDETFARSIGIAVGRLDLMLMTLMSLTVVTSFESVGTILVIALVAAPAMTARLLSKSFIGLIGTSMVIAIINAIIGYNIGIYFDTTISAMVAVISFITFLITFVITKVVIPKISYSTNKLTSH